MNLLPLLLILIPLISTATLLIPKGHHFPISPRHIALTATIINLILTLILAFAYLTKPASSENSAFALQFPWLQLSSLTHGVIPDIHFHIGIDGANLPLLLLTALVSVAAIAYRSEHTHPHHAPTYIALLLIVLGAYGAFLSFDAFFLYIFHEFALIPTFLLIYFQGRSPERKTTALQITLYLTLGSLILLVGLISLITLMPTGTRTFDIHLIEDYFSQNYRILADRPYLAFYLLFIGSAILFSIFPFHSWAPSGYALAPTPVAMLHAGVLKKFGPYILLRLAFPNLPEGALLLNPWITTALLANILYIGFVTLRQHQLHYLLSYSSIMHMGYILLGLLAWNSISLTGALLLMLAHGLSTALLFALCGEIHTRTHTFEMKSIGGLVATAPRLATLFILASMASIGLPGLANFAGEILIFLGAWKAELHLVTILALWGIVISATYQLRAIQHIFFGTPADPNRPTHPDLSPITHWHYYLLALALLILGITPSLLTPSIQTTLSTLLNP
ncbi:MAG: NADH-quinone oxidoreductase subunit M [Methylacidiphilales bacterium]|nr:NADH-quinone oxidoreductase subunit M [Candidatus Methylacidiphilales bacterium]